MIRLDRHGDCALVTLQRPAKLNALNAEMMTALSAVIAEVADSDARALLVTGAGDRAFCAGADLGEAMGRSGAEHRANIQDGQHVFQMIANASVPTVALVNGLALGGGLELALACDFRLASPRATFGFPEIKVGLLPGYGGTQRLPRLIGQSAALELILTGDAIEAERAVELGLVNRVVGGNLVDSGVKFASRITQHSKVTIRLASEAVRLAAEVGLEDGQLAEAELSTQAYLSEDAAEGVAAFLGKRQPAFNDR
jgi:enoyl-CoA hydratase